MRRKDSRLVALAGLVIVAIIVALVIVWPRPDEEELDTADITAVEYIWASTDGLIEPQRVRDFMTDELSERTADVELTRLIHCFPAETDTFVIDQVLEERNERRMDIVVTHAVTRELEGGNDADNGPREVVRTWEFERRGDVWFLSSLPHCPEDLAPELPTPRAGS